MKDLKKTMWIINRTIGIFCFGFGTNRILVRDYQLAAYFLFITTTLFVIGYHAERWNN